jgi:hypothetical protein
MASCGICGKARRTGSGGRVVVLEDGELRSALACAECMGRGVVLTTPPANLPTLTKAPLDADERDIRAVLRKLANHLRGIAKAKRADHERTTQISARGKFDDFDTCADIADGWAARPQVRR